MDKTNPPTNANPSDAYGFDPDDEPTVTIPYETLEQALDQANERWLADAAAGISTSERTTRRMKALPKPGSQGAT